MLESVRDLQYSRNRKGLDVLCRWKSVSPRFPAGERHPPRIGHVNLLICLTSSFGPCCGAPSVENGVAQKRKAGYMNFPGWAERGRVFIGCGILPGTACARCGMPQSSRAPGSRPCLLTPGGHVCFCAIGGHHDHDGRSEHQVHHRRIDTVEHGRFDLFFPDRRLDEHDHQGCRVRYRVSGLRGRLCFVRDPAAREGRIPDRQFERNGPEPIHNARPERHHPDPRASSSVTSLHSRMVPTRSRRAICSSSSRCRVRQSTRASPSLMAP